MARYSFRAYARDGTPVSGEIDATSRNGAFEALARRGEFPVEISEAAGTWPVPWWQREIIFPDRISLPVLAMFTRELVSLVKADLPLDECLRLVALQPLISGRLRSRIERILSRVIEGQALSDSIAAEGNAFPEYYWRLVRAGEESGTLASCLEDLAGFLDRSAEMRGRIVSALLYPAVLVLAALAAIGVIMMVLVPAISPIFAEAGAEPPLVIRVLVAVESTLKVYWPALLAVSVATIASLVMLFRSEGARASFDRMALRLPIAGRLIERRESGRLARTLATLLRNGVPLLDAVSIAQGVLSNGAMRASLAVAEDEIREGGQLSTPLTRSGLYADLFLRLTAIGEQTGQLDTMLARAAEIYDAALGRQMQRLTSLITPVVTLMIGALTGTLILSVMSALVSLNDLALR